MNSNVSVAGRGSGFVAVEIPFTPRAKRVLELSLEEARQLGECKVLVNKTCFSSSMRLLVAQSPHWASFAGLMTVSSNAMPDLLSCDSLGLADDFLINPNGMKVSLIFTAMLLQATTTSVQSTSCSASCVRARVWQPGSWRPWELTPPRSAHRSVTYIGSLRLS